MITIRITLAYDQLYSIRYFGIYSNAALLDYNEQHKPLVQLFKYSIISLHGDRWMFMKEIYSDGDINTVDVVYPSSPLFLFGVSVIMIYAVSRFIANTVDFLGPYWPLFKIWADYIVASLPDPGNQLCSDDFEGPSPHNVNLAAKGMVGLAAYAQVY